MANFGNTTQTTRRGGARESLLHIWEVLRQLQSSGSMKNTEQNGNRSGTLGICVHPPPQHPLSTHNRIITPNSYMFDTDSCVHRGELTKDRGGIEHNGFAGVLGSSDEMQSSMEIQNNWISRLGNVTPQGCTPVLIEQTRSIRFIRGNGCQLNNLESGSSADQQLKQSSASTTWADMKSGIVGESTKSVNSNTQCESLSVNLVDDSRRAALMVLPRNVSSTDVRKQLLNILRLQAKRSSSFLPDIANACASQPTQRERSEILVQQLETIREKIAQQAMLFRQTQHYARLGESLKSNLGLSSGMQLAADICRVLNESRNSNLEVGRSFDVSTLKDPQLPFSREVNVHLSASINKGLRCYGQNDDRDSGLNINLSKSILKNEFDNVNAKGFDRHLTRRDEITRGISEQTKLQSRTAERNGRLKAGRSCRRGRCSSLKLHGIVDVLGKNGDPIRALVGRRGRPLSGRDTRMGREVSTENISSKLPLKGEFKICSEEKDKAVGQEPSASVNSLPSWENNGRNNVAKTEVHTSNKGSVNGSTVYPKVVREEIVELSDNNRTAGQPGKARRKNCKSFYFEKTKGRQSISRGMSGIPKSVVVKLPAFKSFCVPDVLPGNREDASMTDEESDHEEGASDWEREGWGRCLSEVKSKTASVAFEPIPKVNEASVAVRAPVLPARVECYHPLEDRSLLCQSRETQRFECPLCDPSARLPDTYKRNLKHYLCVHWDRRKRIGGFVCFPCRQVHGRDNSQLAEKTSEATNAPRLRRLAASGGRRSDSFCGASPEAGARSLFGNDKVEIAEHFHCPNCTYIAKSFSLIQQHARAEHPFTAADPRLTLAGEELFSPFWETDLGEEILPLHDPDDKSYDEATAVVVRGQCTKVDGLAHKGDWVEAEAATPLLDGVKRVKSQIFCSGQKSTLECIADGTKAHEMDESEPSRGLEADAKNFNGIKVTITDVDLNSRDADSTVNKLDGFGQSSQANNGCECSPQSAILGAKKFKSTVGDEARGFSVSSDLGNAINTDYDCHLEGSSNILRSCLRGGRGLKRSRESSCDDEKDKACAEDCNGNLKNQVEPVKPKKVGFLQNVRVRLLDRERSFVEQLGSTLGPIFSVGDTNE